MFKSNLPVPFPWVPLSRPWPQPHGAPFSPALLPTAPLPIQAPWGPKRSLGFCCCLSPQPWFCRWDVPVPSGTPGCASLWSVVI